MTILDLSHNKLKGLAPEAFDKHSYSTELRLNNNQVIKVNIENIHFKKDLLISISLE